MTDILLILIYALCNFIILSFVVILIYHIYHWIATYISNDLPMIEEEEVESIERNLTKSRIIYYSTETDNLLLDKDENNEERRKSANSVHSATYTLSPILEEDMNGTKDDDARAIIFAAEFCNRSIHYLWKEHPLLDFNQRPERRYFLIGSIGQEEKELPTTEASFLSLVISIILEPFSRKKINNDNLLLMSIIPKYGNLEDPTMLAYAHQILQTLQQHPNIQKIYDLQIVATKSMGKVAVTITDVCHEGSLRDRIFRCQANKSGLTGKRGIKRLIGDPLPLTEISKYGRQVLQGLVAFRQMGLRFYHLHTGNVLIKNGNALLTNCENMLLCCERSSEMLQLALPLLKTIDYDLILFGYFLYELTFGITITSSRVNDNGIPHYHGLTIPSKPLQEVFETIFMSTSTTKRSRKLCPEDLLILPFFITYEYQIPMDVVMGMDSDDVINQFSRHIMNYYKIEEMNYLRMYYQQKTDVEKKKQIEKKKQRKQEKLANLRKNPSRLIEMEMNLAARAV